MGAANEEYSSEQLEVFNGGVNSAVDPRFIGNNQVSWAMNTTFRGGRPKTRPSFKLRLQLPDGLFQGCGYFSVQGGMLVASVSGKIYRIRVNGPTFSYEEVPLTFENSPNRKQAWFCQTVESLVIQDGQSDPIIYNGDTARRSDVTGLVNYNANYDADKSDAENLENLLPEVPIGKQMAYGNGRLWVAQGDYNLVAGDIRTSESGSELYFTENSYLSGGGALYFPKGINALAFMPTTGGGDYGALVVCGNEETDTVRADITNRDTWEQIPAFVSPAFRSVGCAGQGSIVAVNQDLYWRDDHGGIRSMRSAAADQQSAGLAPISREVSRITDYESQKYLSYCSSILSDNRLLMTGNPFLLGNGGVGFKSIIALDFANISTMQGKTPPAYDGHWTGFDFVQLVSGRFGGKSRDFAVVYRDETYQIWEIDYSEIKDSDIYSSYGSRIISTIEYGRKSFGDIRTRKRLEQFEVYLADIDGEVDVDVYWRTDNDNAWHKWDAVAKNFTAKTTDETVTTPHTWKNLVRQNRPQIRQFTIPTSYNAITGFQAHVGFEFQFRVVVTGQASIYRAFAHAKKTAVQDTRFARPYTSDVLTEDVTGNIITYVFNPTYASEFSDDFSDDFTT